MEKVVSKQVMQASIDAITSRVSVITLLNQVAQEVASQYPFKGKVAIICGTTDQAGIGYALALLLKKQKVEVSLYLVSFSFTFSSKYYFDLCISASIPYQVFTEEERFMDYDVLVDAIYGLSFASYLSTEERFVIQRINESNKFVISIDINSGLNADNGLTDLCVISGLTISLGCYKPGHFLNMAKDKIGKLICCSEGLDLVGEVYTKMEAKDYAGVLKPRLHNSHKGTYQTVGIIGGSISYSGSIKLANLGLSALRSGCGVARLIVPESLTKAVLPYLLESTLFPIPDKEGQMLFVPAAFDHALDKVAALLIGIGWGKSLDYVKILTYLLTNYHFSVVIDADGINTLAEMDLAILKETACSVVLTPHVKEFSRLSGYSVTQIFKDPIHLACQFAHKYGVIILLKGPTTIITDGKTVHLVDRGSPGMATSGSGDVLAGILVGLCGFNAMNITTVSCAAYIHGLAGELKEASSNAISMIASDTVSYVPQAITEILKEF